MRWQVQSKQNTHRDEHKERPKGNTVHGCQFNRFAHALCRVSRKHTDNRRLNGVRRENEPSEERVQHWVDDQ